jgi:hypothetical protein
VAQGEVLSLPEKINTITWQESTAQLLDFVDDPNGRQNVVTLDAVDLMIETRENMKVTPLLAATAALVACSGDSVSVPSVPIPTACLSKSGVGVGRDGAEALNDGEFVTFAYQTILQRPPDRAGLQHHCDLLSSGRLDRRALVLAMAQLPEAVALSRK